MTFAEMAVTIALLVAGTMLTRFLPFLIFRPNRPTPRTVEYLGRVLPGAIFSMLIVYCLKDVSLIRYSFGIPELIAILATGLLHLWKRQMLLSIAGGTLLYMFLIQVVF